MKQKPAACLLTTDGKLIEIDDQFNVQELFHACITMSKKMQFVQIKTAEKIRFIPTHRIKEVIFYEPANALPNER